MSLDATKQQLRDKGWESEMAGGLELWHMPGSTLRVPIAQAMKIEGVGPTVAEVATDVKGAIEEAYAGWPPDVQAKFRETMAAAREVDERERAEVAEQRRREIERN